MPWLQYGKQLLCKIFEATEANKMKNSGLLCGCFFFFLRNSRLHKHLQNTVTYAAYGIYISSKSLKKPIISSDLRKNPVLFHPTKHKLFINSVC